MAFDALTLKAALDEMQQIVGGRIQKVYQTTTANHYTLSVYRRAKNYQIMISTHRQDARLHLTRRHYTHPRQPNDFCMTLRKHLNSGIITAVHQHGWDRIAKIQVENYDDLGRKRKLTLIAETMGRFSNLLLINESEENKPIIAASRRASGDQNPHRTVLPGHPYKLPPQKDAITPPNLHPEDLFQRAAEADDDIPAWLWMVRNVAGPGPKEAQRILAEIEIDPEGEVPTDQDDLRQLVDKIAYCATVAEKQQWQPWMRKDSSPEEGPNLPRSIEYGVLPQKRDSEVRIFPDVSHLLDAHYALQQQWNTYESLKKKLTKELESAYKKVEKKIKRQKSDLARASDAEKYKKWGELLTAYMYQVPEGAEKVTLPDYYQDGKPTEIPLDPKKSPSKNASNYFDHHRKMERTQKKAKIQIRRSQHELRYVDSLRDQAERAENLPELRAIRDEAKKGGYLQTDSSQRSKTARSSPPRPYYTYITPSGDKVLVGRNNRGNDHLTMRKASREDYWFHVQDIAGAHVIIPGKRELTEQLKEEAALLAAYHSAGRHSSNVAVDYTKVKYVKKPKGAKPGMVTYRNHQTIFVTPPRKLEGFRRKKG